MRLLLFRQGVPEVDHPLRQPDPLVCQREIRACIAAWQARVAAPPRLGWWFSVQIDKFDDWKLLVDDLAREVCLNEPLPALAEPTDPGVDVDVLSPLQHLALLALYQEER